MDEQNITNEEMRKCPMCGGEMTPAYWHGMCFWECTQCGNWEEWE